MSRSGYCDDGDYDNWATIRWRGAVASAIRGKRGQALLREMVAALEAMPEKRLIARELDLRPAVAPAGDVFEGGVCALGAVGRARGMDMSALDPEDHETVAGAFGIPHALACEIFYENDEAWWRSTPEARYEHMLGWAKSHLKTEAPTHAD